jgi:hypothetical protein
MAFQPHLPEALVDVMTRALQIHPSDRYPNASALTFDLRRVAFAMGVGDGRVFLRRTLDRELGEDGSEVTAERPYSTAPPPVPVQPGDLLELADLDGMPTVVHPGGDGRGDESAGVLDPSRRQ